MEVARICITGFRPFPGVPVNPSATLLTALADDPAWRADAAIAARLVLLDTVYAGLAARLEALLDAEPAALVLTGYSSIATGLKIELRATDRCLPDRPDASGARPSSAAAGHAIDNDGVDGAALVAALRRARVPARLSRDAGAYVCNHAYYHALRIIAERGLRTRALFVHLPAIEGMAGAPESAATMPLDRMREAIAAIARALVRQAQPST